MDFGLSDEQKLLEETIRRYLDTEAPITRVREIVETPTGHHQALWKELAELGVAGILVPEEHGGSALTLLDAAVAAESLVCQNEISRYEQVPTPSQPRNVTNRFSPSTSTVIDSTNRFMYRKNFENFGSPCIYPIA